MDSPGKMWLEQVFFRQHVRCAKAVMAACSPRTRARMEVACGAVAASSVILLVVLHVGYVGRPTSPLAVAFGGAVGALERAHRVAGGRGAGPWSVRVLVGGAGDACAVASGAPWDAPDAGVAAYVFARDRGVASLGADARDGLRAPSGTVSCGAAAVARAPFFRAAGVDYLVANAAVASVGASGFLRAELSSEVYDLGRAALPPRFTREWSAATAAVALKTLFLIFATSTLVSYTLRETQARMLRFAFELKESVRTATGYSSLVAAHLLDSAVFAPIMIGMMAFLFEFFADQVLGLLVLTLAWGVELFAAVSLRSRRALDHLPHLLILYLAALHVYLFKFPFGFKYVALLAAVAAIGHAMLFFWGRYEVAALRDGSVSVANLRQIGRGPGRGVPRRHAT